MNKPIVAIDLDDTLADFLGAFVHYARRTWNITIDPETYSDDWISCLGINIDQWRAMNDQIGQDADWWYRTFRPLPMARKAVRYLSQYCTLVGITARQRKGELATRFWTKAVFADSIQECYFLGAYDEIREDSSLLTKGALCKKIGAKCLVDDQPRHCLGARENDVPSVLFGRYNWSRDFIRPRNVLWMPDWSCPEIVLQALE